MTVHSDQTGFTLIEVLVTLLIIAIGLLGLGALQVNTMNDQFEANQRAYATSLVDDMASRIRANNAILTNTPLSLWRKIARLGLSLRSTSNS